MIRFHITDIDMLQACYLPFIEGGALFVPNEKTVALGETQLIMLSYPTIETTPILGTVVWINYQTMAHRPKGFAITLSNPPAQALKSFFEQQLIARPASTTSFTL